LINWFWKLLYKDIQYKSEYFFCIEICIAFWHLHQSICVQKIICIVCTCAVKMRHTQTRVGMVVVW
jgi:hypothetical protein